VIVLCNKIDFGFIAQKKLIYHKQLIPASVAICSNINGFTDPKTFINGDPKVLVEEMYQYLKTLASDAYRQYLQHPTFGPIISKMDDVLHRGKYLQKELRKVTRSIMKYRKEYGSKTGLMEDEQKYSQLKDEMAQLNFNIQIANELIRWCRQLPVIGYNSGMKSMVCKIIFVELMY
jgi:hypothetical protein